MINHLVDNPKLMTSKIATQEQLVNALKDLHKASRLPADEQWFTRVDIGTLLQAPSRSLNPARLTALNTIVDSGVVARRVRPDDKRGTRLQYRLANGG